MNACGHRRGGGNGGGGGVVPPTNAPEPGRLGSAPSGFGAAGAAAGAPAGGGSALCSPARGARVRASGSARRPAAAGGTRVSAAGEGHAPPSPVRNGGRAGSKRPPRRGERAPAGSSECAPRPRTPLLRGLVVHKRSSSPADVPGDGSLAAERPIPAGCQLPRRFSGGDGGGARR